jgi:hypothetical protein
MLVKLKMLTKGPNGNYQKGAVVTVDSERATILVKGKHAEVVTDDRLQER